MPSARVFVMTNRRQFFTACSALALTASLAPAACLSAFLPGRRTVLDQFDFVTFSAQVGTAFKIGRKAIELKLVEAKLHLSSRSLVSTTSGAGAENFSLLFYGPGDRPLTQDTYCFEHDTMGCFEMFIVPAPGGDSSRTYYHAVFNRVVQSVLT
jgi:hypothetical protein